jgi:hypothetical protein
MERHIKQQHPQFWAQRQRGNHGLMRRGPPTQMSMNGPPMMPTLQAAGFGGISDQVKYAILAQQLKARESPKNMMNSPYPHLQLPLQTQLTTPHHEALEKSLTPATIKEDDDEDDQLVIDEDFDAEDLSKSSDGHEKNFAARKIAENILEEAMKMGSSHAKSIELNNMKEAAAKFADSENEKDSDREQKRECKEETNDLVSVSKLVDNATNSMIFSNYFR